MGVAVGVRVAVGVIVSVTVGVSVSSSVAVGEGVAVYHGPPGFFVGVGVLVFGFGFEGLSVAVGFDGGGGGVGVGSAANAVVAAIQGRIRAKITNAGKNLGPSWGLFFSCFTFLVLIAPLRVWRGHVCGGPYR